MTSRMISELPMIRRMGRIAEADGHLALFWSASGVDFCFRGSSVSAEFTSDYSTSKLWIAVEADGHPLLRMPLQKGCSSVTIFHSADPYTFHRIRIFREVPVFPDDPESFLTLDSLRFDGEITSPPASDLMIEFVGDSLTCGQGTAKAAPEKSSGGFLYSPDLHYSAENSYPRMVSDILNAEFRCIAVSGWGVLSDYRNDPSGALPSCYEQVCGPARSQRNILAHAAEPYDFKAKSANFVVVNLGANDEWAFRHSEDHSTASFENAVVSFLAMLRKDNPEAHIIWCYGMLGDLFAHEIARSVYSCQSASGDLKVHYLLLPPTGKQLLAQDGHPGKAAHEKVAKILASYIRELRIRR